MNYGYHAPQQPKSGLSTAAIIAIVIGCTFGGCIVLGAASSASKKSTTRATSATTATVAAPTSTPSVEKRAAPAPTQAPRLVGVTASVLFNDYQANEVSADAKYKGKRLLVTGVVQSVDKGPLGGIHVRLATPNQFMPVDASLEDGQEGAAANLTKGQIAKFTCQGEGLVIGRPQLDDCTL